MRQSLSEEVLPEQRTEVNEQARHENMGVNIKAFQEEETAGCFVCSRKTERPVWLGGGGRSRRTSWGAQVAMTRTLDFI